MGEGWFSNRNGFFRVELGVFLGSVGWIFEDDLFGVRGRYGRMKIPTANFYEIREYVICGHMRILTANNRESSRIAFFLFRPLDLRSRHYATPDRLRVAVTAERKMLETPRRGFSLQDKECLNNSRQSS